MPLTQALVTRHAANRKDSYEIGLLDVAQDHALRLLQLSGFFDGDDVVFKGGTSLRKCRLGAAGRFSTDIDLSVPSDDDVVAIVSALDQQAIGGFRFSVRDGDAKDGRKWFLDFEHPTLGPVSGLSRLDFARRRPTCAPERLVPVKLPIHSQYDFTLGALPVVTKEEACAEKLARYRRSPPLARDLYDLSWFAGQVLNEALVRRLWVLKVYSDVVEEGRGTKPLSPDDVLRKHEEKEFEPGSIGLLTQPTNIPAWEAKVRARFAFLAAMDDREKQLATCNGRDLELVHSLLEGDGFNPPSASLPP